MGRAYGTSGMKNVHKILVGTPNVRDHLGDLRIYEPIILKRITGKIEYENVEWIKLT
jgi:hypothetical protein